MPKSSKNAPAAPALSGEGLRGQGYCEKATTRELCHYLRDLQPWIQYVTKYFREAASGEGINDPPDPPVWPPS